MYCIRRRSCSSRRVADEPQIDQPEALADDLLQWVRGDSTAALHPGIAFDKYSAEASHVEFDAYVNDAWSMSDGDRHVLS